MQFIYQKINKEATNPGATLFTESDTRATLNSNNSNIHLKQNILQNMGNLYHFVKPTYPNMQKNIKKTIVHGRKLTKNTGLLTFFENFL